MLAAIHGGVDVLREARERAGVSIGELAARLGVTRATVQSYQRAADAGTIQVNTLCRALGALGLVLEVEARKPTPVSRSHYSKRYEVLPLNELAGPSSGTVRLPGHLWWQPEPADGVFDLADEISTIDMYSAVLDSGTKDEIATLVDADRLRALWPLIPVPLRARTEWERVNPELAVAHAPRGNG